MTKDTGGPRDYPAMDDLAELAEVFDETKFNEQLKEETEHQKCFHCGAYADECMCDGGLDSYLEVEKR